ncbi:IS3 family transposase [Patescibacteria group bacterium]|nr:IS3 family transposase [Patescibacteria group bacterium]
MLIDEAVAAGARCFMACRVLDISKRTYSRWKYRMPCDKRKGAAKRVANKLSDAERQKIIDTACSPEFQHMMMYEIVAKLAERHTYIASESTFYRTLKALNLLRFRGNTAPARRSSKPPERRATGPNQVLTWDITYLRTQVAGIFFYAYLVIDIFSRKIVGWEISAEESETISSRLFERLGRDHDMQSIYLHADRGNPMKGATMLMTLYKLGVIPSFSRPRVSDDNPYSESLFKTVKYHRTYPRKFVTVEEAREWFAGFILWYNTEHLHTGIGLVTPEARHNGTATAIYATRNETYARAHTVHPERWSRKPKNWAIPSEVYLNPSNETKERLAAEKNLNSINEGVSGYGLGQDLVSEGPLRVPFSGEKAAI